MKRISKNIRTIRLSVVALAISISLLPAKAGFLDDFYDQSGATTNVTPAGVYQGQSSSVVSGGGISYRVPNRTFSPLTFSPPNFKAGCGGIDLYLGAFGFPSSAEMTAFMRNVGQAAGGIAFSIALKALSPELDSTINDFSKRIQELRANFSNSCQAASQLMEATGGSAFVQEMAQNARKYLRETSSDETQAEVKAADPKLLKENSIGFANSNPSSGLNPERNVVWDGLSSGYYFGSLSHDEKLIIMSIVGTVVVTISDPADNSLPVITYHNSLYPNIDAAIDKFIGGKADAGGLFLAYRCTDKPTSAAPMYVIRESGGNCLVVDQFQSTIFAKGFRAKLEDSKNAVMNAIRTRSTLNTTVTNHYANLHGATSLPLLKIVQSAASTRNPFVAETLLEQYLDVAAKEMAIRYLRFAIAEINRIKIDTPSLETTEMLRRVKEDANNITVKLDAREAALKIDVGNLAGQLKMYETLQTYMQSSLGADLSRSLKFGG